MTEFINSHSDSFVHLHLHTQYSLLDGAIRLKDLFAKAREFQMPAVAITDHGNMFGMIDFYKQARAAEVKPILGCEVYLTPGSRFDRGMPKRSGEALASQDAEESRYAIHHLVLLAKNKIGYQNLCQIVTQANMEGFYYKPRADMDLLRKYSEGLIASSACLKGEVGWNFFTDQDERAMESIKRYQEIFGDDFYLEIQENGLAEQEKINPKIIQASKDFGIGLVATNDCHYIEQEDAKAQEVLLCIQTGKTLMDEKRMKLTSSEFYFKSPEVMRNAFHYAKEACDNTLRIADQCDISFKWTDEKGSPIYLLPDYSIESGETPDNFFDRMAREGLQERFEGPQFKNVINQPNWESELKPQYYERLDYELKMIKQMEFPGYFLIVSDFIKWAKEQGIPVGPGRGSGAGSLVAYSLQITNINPLPYNLLFERFINPERISMPDFDVDFCQDGRAAVLDYVGKKYGQDKVGNIITFGQLLAKGVIRDVSRVFGLPYNEADFLAKLIPDELKMTLDKALELEPKLKELEQRDPKIRQIIKISRRLEGLYKSAGMHACGIIITNDPLVDNSPIFRGKEGERVVQYDKNFSEEIGFVKFDFLGLKTLTVIRGAVDFIKRDFDPTFDIEFIDMEDEKVFDFVSTGNTIGIFQLESSGMQNLCKKIGPDTVDDITAINALYRPGPLGSGMVDDFIERKRGVQDITYPFDVLEPILKDTYGIIVYQEQVMNIARILADYSLGQADMLRKAMGKKKESEMNRHREIFREGSVKNGYDEKKVLELYDLMAKFAEYGFNKSHAVAYAYIAYQTAYLKTYYPAPFFASILSTDMNNTDKVTGYIANARAMEIEILPPDVNESLYLFNVIGDNVRFGMGAIKSVGEGPVIAIVEEREQNGPFKGFVDFCERIDWKRINKRVVEALIKVGAFDQCERMNRMTLLENMELVISFGQKLQEEKLLGQCNIFDMGSGPDKKENSQMLSILEVEDFGDKEKLQHEKDLLGIFVSGHPLDRFSEVLDQLTSMKIRDLHEMQVEVAHVDQAEQFKSMRRGEKKRNPNHRDMTLGGLVVEFKSFITKKGDRMAFATLEDLTGKIECIVFKDAYEKFGELLTSDEPLLMNGYVDVSEDPRKFFPQKMKKVEDEAEDKVTAVRIHLAVDQLNKHRLKNLKQVILGHRGTVPVQLIFSALKGRAMMPLDEGFLVTPTPRMAAEINEVLDANAVKFIIGGSS